MELQVGRRPEPPATGHGTEGAADAKATAAARAGAVPSEVELVVAVSDALIPSVKCFRPYWKKLVKEVTRILEAEACASSAQGGAEEEEHRPPPLLLRSALALVREDLKVLRAP